MKKMFFKEHQCYKWDFGLTRADKKKILLIAGLLFGSTFMAVNAQTVSLKEKDVPLIEVLEKLRKQANVDLIGNLLLLQATRPVTIEVKDRELKSVLDEISKNQPVTLSLQNNTIVVKAKPRTNNMPGTTDNQPVHRPAQRSAQDEYSLVGTVVDESRRPLKGVTVQLLNSSNWASVTANDGTYSVMVRGNAAVQFSMVGYQTETVKVADLHQINIMLKRKENQLEEVLVNTGYSVRKKESMTGASTAITREELQKFNNNNIFSIIQNLDPAFKVDNNTTIGSNPNALPEITIRGTNSVGEYAVNAPLIILDGFEVPLERLYDLDVNRIERISLLKDASTTVLYGSRGGNGVLVIETRLPKDGKFTLTYDIRPSLTVADLRDYRLMNARQKLAYEQFAGVYTFNNPDMEPAKANEEQTRLDNILSRNQQKILEGVETDWIAQPVQSTLSLAHNIRVEGGSNNVRYSIDANYNYVKGAMKGSGRKRGGAGFNLIYRIPQKITFRNNATFQSTRAYNSPYGEFSRYTLMNPYQPIRGRNGELMVQYEDEFDLGVAYNPLYDAQLAHRDYTTTSVLTNNFSVEWYINPHLILNSKAILEKTFVKGETYFSPFHSSFVERAVEEKGSYRLLNGDGLSYYANLQLTYAKAFDKHALNGSLVGEINGSDMSNTSHLLTGFTTDKFISPSLALQYVPNSRPIYSQVPNRLLGVVATGNYTYDQKYILDLSYRMDGSSKFGRNNRFGNFWSAGVAYNLHRENFFKNKLINEMRIFANMGINGADNFSARMTSTSYILSSQNIYFKDIGLGYNNEGNADLRWPKIKSWSAGMMGKLWDARLSFSLSAYKKVTDQMVSLITVAPSLGIARNAYFENMGKTQNTGFESTLSVKAFENKAKTLNWYVSASAIKNKSKLLEISDALRQLNKSNLQRAEGEDYPQTVYYEQGESLDNIKGVRSLGIDPASGREIFLKKDGMVTYDWNADDVTIVGNKEPKLFGTLNTTVNYRSFSLQAYFNYTLGGDIYNQTLMDKIENSSPYMNADIRVLEQRWKQPGDLALYRGIRDLENNKTQLTSRFVQRENYLRFSALNINYDFPKELIKKYKLERCRLNLAMNDIFRWSTVQMERGIDYPFARTFNMGLMVQF